MSPDPLLWGGRVNAPSDDSHPDFFAASYRL